MTNVTELGITRNGLKEMKIGMAQGALTQPSPKELLRRHSQVMDGLVRKAFQKAQADFPSPSVCLMAVGGYGRAELAPYSDIDLLLVHSTSNTSDLSPLIERTLYPLWDLGLEVNCSSRSVQECLRMARSDIQVRTGLIDGRYLDGEYEFFRALYGRFTKRVLHRKVYQFAEALAKEMNLRHQKHEDPACVLEPNIKEGKGGLRDFQIGRWALRARYRTDRWDSILFPDQSRILDQSLQFLWAIRNHLHLLSGRRQDDFTFEFQEKVAPLLGFPSGARGVEEMMRRYHLSTQRILNFATGVLDRILSDPSFSRKIFFLFRRGKINPLFGISHGELHPFDPALFKKDLSQLMKLFALCQTHRVEMDYRTEEAVMEALPFVDDRFRTFGRINQDFLSILRKGDRLGIILRKMHELGFLSRYIPEFLEIEGRVHYDLYHVHPVDIHSILAVEELERLKSGNYQKEHPLLTSLMSEIDKPELLFLTALLHDLGKGYEGDHSVMGAELAKSIGARMGLPNEEKDILHFLVFHHLFMLETAFRRDLNDERAMIHFAGRIKDMTRLKMLYLLTFADIKAVGPEAWTHWKDSLLMELFLKTAHIIEKGEATAPISKEDDLRVNLSGFLSPEAVSEYLQSLPARYLSCYPRQEIEHHLDMARSLESEPLRVEWVSEEGKRAKVTVCTRDRYGLFSKMTGCMFVNRLNILEAQIHTWANGVALDTFRVEDGTGEAERRLCQFKKDLEEVLKGTVSMKGLLSRRRESNGILKKVIPRVSPDVEINNHDSDSYTIIEVVGEDRLGVLYEITRALTDHGCDIHFARVSTLGNRIVDIFYVQDAWGEKIEGTERIERLRRTLLDQMVLKEPPDLAECRVVN